MPIEHDSPRRRIPDTGNSPKTETSNVTRPGIHGERVVRDLPTIRAPYRGSSTFTVEENNQTREVRLITNNPVTLFYTLADPRVTDPEHDVITGEELGEKYRGGSTDPALGNHILYLRKKLGPEIIESDGSGDVRLIRLKANVIYESTPTLQDTRATADPPPTNTEPQTEIGEPDLYLPHLEITRGVNFIVVDIAHQGQKYETVLRGEKELAVFNYLATHAKTPVLKKQLLSIVPSAGIQKIVGRLRTKLETKNNLELGSIISIFTFGRKSTYELTANVSYKENTPEAKKTTEPHPYALVGDPNRKLHILRITSTLEVRKFTSSLIRSIPVGDENALSRLELGKLLYPDKAEEEINLQRSEIYLARKAIGEKGPQIQQIRANPRRRIKSRYYFKREEPHDADTTASRINIEQPAEMREPDPNLPHLEITQGANFIIVNITHQGKKYETVLRGEKGLAVFNYLITHPRTPIPSQQFVNESIPSTIPQDVANVVNFLREKLEEENDLEPGSIINSIKLGPSSTHELTANVSYKQTTHETAEQYHPYTLVGDPTKGKHILKVTTTLEVSKLLSTLIRSIPVGEENALSLLELGKLLYPDKREDEINLTWVSQYIYQARKAIGDRGPRIQRRQANSRLGIKPGYYFKRDEQDVADTQSTLEEIPEIVPKIDTLTKYGLTHQELSTLAWSLATDTRIRRKFQEANIPFFPSDETLHQIIEDYELPDVSTKPLIMDYLIPALERVEELINSGRLDNRPPNTLKRSDDPAILELLAGLSLMSQYTFLNKQGTDEISSIAFVKECYTDPATANGRYGKKKNNHKI